VSAPLLALLGAAQAAPMTMAEVARHDTAGDCWMVVEGVVYDVTAWIPAHPGGAGITRGCGKDATWYWQHRQGDEGHSDMAAQVLQAYRLGALGEEPPADHAPPPPPHPHSLRLARSSLGLGTLAATGPARSLVLRVKHAISTDTAVPSGIGVQLGYAFGRVDLVVRDEQAAGIGGLEAKGRVLDQRAGAPLSAAVVAGGGMGYKAGAPVLWGQAIVERDLLEQRLVLAASSSAATSPGVDDSGRVAAGGSLEFRPIPIHGVFAEVQVPMADPAALAWAAGLSLYTRQHTFALYAASTPLLHPASLAAPTPQALAIGGSFERAFQLGR
jgi:hypothetical protein